MAEEKSFTSILRVVNDYDDDNNNGCEVLYLKLLGIRFEKQLKPIVTKQMDMMTVDVLGFCM